MVYRLDPPATGQTTWTVTPIYNFQGGTSDGAGPNGLVITANGTIVGSTATGGSWGEGTVYTLTHSATGWTETILRSYRATKTGTSPVILSQDAHGLVYGTVSVGHCDELDPGCTAILKLTPPAAGGTAWSFTGLHSTYPNYLSSIVPDNNGGVYAIEGSAPSNPTSIVHLTANAATTIYPIGYGGNYSIAAGPNGTLYFSAPTYDGSAETNISQLTPPASGKTWRSALLYAFDQDNDGVVLNGSKNGILYGTFMGPVGPTLVALTPPASGETGWSAETLASFDQNAIVYPISFAADGSIYGATQTNTAVTSGPSFNAIFKLSPSKSTTTGWTEEILNKFDGHDGYLASATLLPGPGGVLYGTTRRGGDHDYGTVYELVPSQADPANWTERILYSFGSNPAMGRFPAGPVIADAAGALYGTTAEGGSDRGGVVYKLTPPTAGQSGWTETILSNLAFSLSVDYYTYYNFSEGLLMDPSGVLYGTTFYSGNTNAPDGGTVFALTPPTAGKASWTRSTIYQFPNNDGGPVNPLLRDASGNLYGINLARVFTEIFVFELIRPAPGSNVWHKQILYRCPIDVPPVGGLIMGADGALYLGSPTAFVRLAPPAPGHKVWDATTLYRFPHGGRLQGGLVEKNGSFYGPGVFGPYGLGEIFKLSPSQSGSWTATSVYNFTDGADGDRPDTSLTFGKDGALYGVASGSGVGDRGVVFRLVP